MIKKLFVGNLPYSAKQDSLEELFGQAGKVESCNIITDKFSGQSRGFAFVEMPNDAEAQKAIQNLNGKELKVISQSLTGIHIANKIAAGSIFL